MDTYLPFIIFICGLLPLLMGSLAIVGWYTRSPHLVQLHPNFVPMQFNTALGFLVCGIGLLLLGFSEIQGVKVASAFILIVGGLTLFQYVTRIDCGIDQFFMKHYITIGTSHPGRMAPNTALCFILTALAFLMNASQQHSILQILTSGILGASIFAFGAIALLGYLLQVQPAYGWGYLTKMAIPTALGFGCVGLGLLTFSCCFWIPRDITIRAEATVVVFVVGLIMASLLTLAVHYIQRDRQLMKQLHISHQSLLQEVSDRKEAEQVVQRSREELRNLSNRLQLVREEEKTQMALRLTPVEGLVTIQVWGAQRIRRTCGNFVNASLHGRLVLNIWCRVAGPMGLFVPSAGGSRPGSTPSATCSSVGRVGVRLRRWPRCRPSLESQRIKRH